LSKHTIDQLDATLRSYDAAAAAMETAQIARTTLDQASFDQAQTAAVKLEQTWQTYSNAVGALRRSGNLIAQWSKATRTDLMKLSLAEVLEKSKGFRVKRKVEHGEIVYKFKSGWTVESLSGKRQLDCETGFLSHCVYRYKDRVDSGQSVIYSLRDPDGVPYVTMEWEPGPKKGIFKQVFGKVNSRIGDGVFREYVLAAGQDNDPPLQPDQVSVVVEAIRSMVVEFIDQKHGGEVNGILLVGEPLSGRDLTDVFLRGEDLSGVNMVGTKLANAKLGHADLSDADLSGADLRGADLSEAVFDNTKLVGADLRGARFDDDTFLIGADLSRADLRGVDLSRTTLMTLFSTGPWDPLPPREIRATMSGAKYDSETLWPEDFDPIAAGAVKVD
jgi:uncharacterized protein YjbI with pentapeptide repeats